VDTPPDGVRSREGLARPLAVANLVCQVGIVVTGGLVRLTGSGLGCPTWPQCVPGSYTPVVEQPEGYHRLVEFGNRLLTLVLTAVAVATLVAVVRLAGRSRDAGSASEGRGRRGLILLGAAPLAGVLAQAVLGGVTVLTSLHPATVAAHFLLSMVIVAGSTVLLLRLRPPTVWDHRPRAEVRLLVAGLAVTTAVVVVLGTVVTGSGPHSGDADEPARFGLDPRAMSWIHADAALLLVGLAIAVTVALRLVGAPESARRRSGDLLAVLLLQALVGYVQYATDLPEVLVAAHMLGASLLVVTVTAVATAVLDPRGASPDHDSPPGHLPSPS